MSKFDEVKKVLQKRGYEIDEVTVNKNNQPRMGLVFREVPCSPVGYKDTITLTSMSAEEIADMMIEALKEPPTLSVSDYLSRKYILDNADFKVIRKDWNPEIIKESVSYDIPGTDLAAIVRINVAEAEGSFAYKKGMSPEISDYEIIQHVLEKYEGDSYSLFPMAKEMVFCMAGLYGASVILNTNCLDKAREYLGSNRIYIIPSSIHEIICVPDDMGDAESLRQIISDVNSEVVSVEDRLSDHPYLYDGVKLSNIGITPELILDDLF